MDSELWRLLGVLAVFFCIGPHPSSSEIKTSDLLPLFQSLPELAQPRDPITNNVARSALQTSLRQRLSSIVSHALSSTSFNASEQEPPHQFLQQPFNSSLYSSLSRQEARVQGTNFILVFRPKDHEKETVRERDEPLILLANYDTDLNAPNPLEDNGSGVVLLLSIAEEVAHLLSQGRLELRNSLILAFTDLALGKHQLDIPVRGVTGAEALIQRWLGRYMENRRKLHGAIVLDSVSNFRDEEDTQDAYQLRSSFPFAYERISEGRLRGDFLGLVSRQDYEDDARLAKAFEKSWNSTAGISKLLVNFDFTNHSLTSHMQAPRYFLRSEQTAFWNPEKEGNKRLRTKQLPAILLTDTGRYRRSVCPKQCTVGDLATEKNLRFMAQTGNALIDMVKGMQWDEQMDPNGGVKFGPMWPTTFIVLGVAFHKLFSTL